MLFRSADNTVTMRQVKVGMAEGNDISIDDGLQPGDTVVVDGAEKLVDGMKVNLARGSDGGKRGNS